MPPPTTPKELKRVCGMFADYAKWIHNFSAKAGLLLKARQFPLDGKSLEAFAILKQDLALASLATIRDDLPLKSKVTHLTLPLRQFYLKGEDQWHLSHAL